MREPNNNWKLLNIFSEIWSKEYNGEQYPRSGRDMRATKVFLELYPYFFADEIEIENVKYWMRNFMQDNFWYKPNGNPPLMHEFHHFVDHVTKYSSAQKNIKYTPKPVNKPVSRMIFCTTCHTEHSTSSPCKFQTSEEINSLITKSLNK